MKELKNKYVRSVIKLGNSYAMTFPQEWTNQANLKEKSEVTLYPIDDRSIIIRTFDKEKKTIFNIDGNEWPVKLIKQAIISAFKLNVDEIYIKYNDDNQEDIYKLIINLERETIGFDFKDNSERKEFFINFLLDTSSKPFQDILMDLSEVFRRIIKNVIEGITKKNSELLLAEIERKYSLGTRILITGLSDYPVSEGYRNIPLIRFLGDRVMLLYIRDFINEALTLKLISNDIIKKFSEILIKIPSLLINLIKNYDNINLDSISNFQGYLSKLGMMLENFAYEESNIEVQQVRNKIKYYLNSFQNFFDIGITRLIESEIGMV
ncbi:MAG: AbrB/MazE/SpoVT family DNA-binding domain-containing protein [Candidatus Thorarchaeota archaeon]